MRDERTPKDVCGEAKPSLVSPQNSPLQKQRGNWSRDAARNYFWDCHWRRAGQLLANLFPLFLVTVPVVFAKVNSAQFPSRLIRIFLSTQLFLSGYGYRPHVSSVSGGRIDPQLFKSLSRAEEISESVLCIRECVDAKSGYFLYPLTSQDRAQFFTVNI